MNAKIEEIITDFKEGKMLIVTDDENRENEGDLVVAGELITADMVNFMITHGKGLVCAPVSKEITERLELEQVTKKNTEYTGCKFTISIDHKLTTTTGISAFDRANTIKALCDPKSKAEDFARPGHIFPLETEKSGITIREGHTEASIELCKLAELKEVAVICEIIDDDGHMCKGKKLQAYAKKHQIKMISIEELKTYLQTR